MDVNPKRAPARLNQVILGACDFHIVPLQMHSEDWTDTALRDFAESTAKADTDMFTARAVAFEMFVDSRTDTATKFVSSESDGESSLHTDTRIAAFLDQVPILFRVHSEEYRNCMKEHSRTIWTELSPCAVRADHAVPALETVITGFRTAFELKLTAIDEHFKKRLETMEARLHSSFKRPESAAVDDPASAGDTHAGSNASATTHAAPASPEGCPISPLSSVSDLAPEHDVSDRGILEEKFHEEIAAAVPDLSSHLSDPSTSAYASQLKARLDEAVAHAMKLFRMFSEIAEYRITALHKFDLSDGPVSNILRGYLENLFVVRRSHLDNLSGMFKYHIEPLEDAMFIAVNPPMGETPITISDFEVQLSEAMFLFECRAAIYHKDSIWSLFSLDKEFQRRIQAHPAKSVHNTGEVFAQDLSSLSETKEMREFPPTRLLTFLPPLQWNNPFTTWGDEEEEDPATLWSPY